MHIKVGDWVKIVNPRWSDDEINMEMKNKVVKIIFVINNDTYRFRYKGWYKIIKKDEFILYKPILKKFIEEMEKKEK